MEPILYSYKDVLPEPINKAISSFTPSYIFIKNEGNSCYPRVKVERNGEVLLGVEEVEVKAERSRGQQISSMFSPSPILSPSLPCVVVNLIMSNGMVQEYEFFPAEIVAKSGSNGIEWTYIQYPYVGIGDDEPIISPPDIPTFSSIEETTSELEFIIGGSRRKYDL